MSDILKADILGLFFGQYNTAPGETPPSMDLTIKLSELMGLGSERIIVGRFTYQNSSGQIPTLVTKVSIDGEPSQDYGGFNKFPGAGGVVDLPVFKYPNTAKALAAGKHTIIVTPGLHWAIFGSPQSYETVWPTTTWYPPKTFTITLV
jgi:hypothetical protein